MAKKQDPRNSSNTLGTLFSTASSQADRWQVQMRAVAERFNHAYRGEPFQLPEAVEAMPVFQEWASGALSAKTTSAFWKLATIKKNQSCLDLGCGVSFLIYPWREWEAFFYGQEISTVARDALNARGPQLNSKLFKGVSLGAAHQLNYEQQFDWVIATGFSCYFALDYWSEVLTAVKRVLKPEGQFVFDVVSPETPLAENWAILETYLGAEVFLEPLAEWEKLLQTTGAKITGQQTGELFQLYRVRF